MLNYSIVKFAKIW